MKRLPHTYDQLPEGIRKQGMVEACRHYQMLMMEELERLRAYSETAQDYVDHISQMEE